MSNQELNDWLDDDDKIEDGKTTLLGPDLSSPQDLNPKKFVKSIFAVYNHMGGDQWLLEFAREYEVEFFKMLKSLIPKNYQVEDTTARIQEPDLSETSLEDLEEIYKNAVGE